MSVETGKLYLVATPLGNLEDITQRALRILREVDLIAAEDTRHTLKLLNHFQIKKKMISYYQHKERERTAEIIPRLIAGENVALVSDAGMPGISDPGNVLVAEAIERGIPVVPIPGPSALILALAASGFDTGTFRFEGFLPRRAKLRDARLWELVAYPGSLVFYEAPHRLKTTLAALFKILGNRRAVLARELTKLHEEFIRGTLQEILQVAASREWRGEFTLVIAGNDPGGSAIDENRQNSTNVSPEPVPEKPPFSQGSLREELRAIALKTGQSTKEVYRMYLREKEKKTEGNH